MTELSNLLPFFQKDLLTEIAQNSSIHSFEKNTEILRKGQYVKVIPVVIKGLVKVFTEYNEKELLLYYIKPSESCVMSFAVSLKNEPSKVFAITEEATEILLLPVDKLLKWVNDCCYF